MKIIIDNYKFDYQIGLRLLKLKYETSPFEEINDIWDSIIPMTFVEITSHFKNIEERRVAFNCLGIERLVSEIDPELVDSETITKTTTWINSEGVLEIVTYDDTYELYVVKGEKLTLGSNGYQPNEYYVKFKDTSTKRDYMVWVNANQIPKKRAIDAIAWTFLTMVPMGKIEKIIRQGDCILFKTKPNFNMEIQERHLTADEYRNLLVLES